MTIKSHDESGFVVTVTKEGQVVGEARFEYAALGAGENASPLALWAIRNGLSQALTDCGAGKDAAAFAKAFAAKAERFAAGDVPRESAGRGPAMGQFDRELSDVVEAFLRKRGEKATVAKEAAKKPQFVADSLGAAIAKAKGGNAEDYAAKLLGLWTETAQRRLDDLKTLDID